MLVETGIGYGCRYLRGQGLAKAAIILGETPLGARVAEDDDPQAFVFVHQRLDDERAHLHTAQQGVQGQQLRTLFHFLKDDLPPSSDSVLNEMMTAQGETDIAGFPVWTTERIVTGEDAHLIARRWFQQGNDPIIGFSSQSNAVNDPL